MEYAVIYKEKKVGKVRIEIYDIWVSFQVECMLDSLDVFRCYGRIAGVEPLLLGVLEPKKEGEMVLSREFSMTQLNQKGAYPQLPTEYFLLGGSDSCKRKETSEKAEKNHVENDPEEWTEISDPLIVSGVQKGEIQMKGQKVYCPFDPEKPNPMNFMLAVCHLEKENDRIYNVYEMQSKKE